MSVCLEPISYVCNLLKQELDLPSDLIIHATDKLSKFGADNGDYLSIFHKLGIRPLSRYVDVGADKLTDEGEKVCRELGVSFRNGFCNRTTKLQEIAQRVTAEDVLKFYLAFQEKSKEAKPYKPK